MNERVRELLDRIEPVLDQLRDRWEDLDDAQKRYARIAGIVLAVALPLLIVVLPLASGRLAAHRDVAAVQAQLDEMRSLERLVLAKGLNTAAQAAEAPRAGGGSLLRTVDGIARRVGINDLIQAMRPISKDDDSESVEIQLKGLVLDEFVEFLYQLEIDPGGVYVRRLEVAKSVQEPNVMRASLELVR